MNDRIPLEVIKINAPCPASWDQMAGDDRSRYCEHCQKHVFDFAAMPRDEAERLICASAGTLCARVSRDDQGTVITLDYAPAKRRRRWPIWAFTGVAASLAAVLSLFAQNKPKPSGSSRMAGMICLPSTKTSPVPTSSGAANPGSAATEPADAR
jgi:hypothetical protein